MTTPFQPLYALADRIPHLAWLTGEDGVTQYCNAPCREYLGLSAKEMLGWNWQWAIHPGDLTRVARAWRWALRSGDPYHADYRLRRVDRVYRWHVGWALPVRNATGQLVTWLCVSSDLGRADQVVLAASPPPGSGQ